MSDRTEGEREGRKSERKCTPLSFTQKMHFLPPLTTNVPHTLYKNTRIQDETHSANQIQSPVDSKAVPIGIRISGVSLALLLLPRTVAEEGRAQR